MRDPSQRLRRGLRALPALAALPALIGVSGCVAGRDSLIATADVRYADEQSGDSAFQLDPDAIIVGAPDRADPGRVVVSSASGSTLLASTSGHAFPASLVYFNGNAVLPSGAPPFAALAVSTSPLLPGANGLSVAAAVTPSQAGSPAASVSAIAGPATVAAAVSAAPGIRLSAPGESVQVATSPVLGAATPALSPPAAGTAAAATGAVATVAGAAAGLAQPVIVPGGLLPPRLGH